VSLRARAWGGGRRAAWCPAGLFQLWLREEGGVEQWRWPAMATHAAKAADRWDSVEYFIVREWQDRGVLHVHALVRIARLEAPSDVARTTVAVSRVDGSMVKWGPSGGLQSVPPRRRRRQNVWYLSKALNYVLEDVASDAGGVPIAVWRHQVAFGDAARRMRCSRDCETAELLEPRPSALRVALSGRERVAADKKPHRLVVLRIDANGVAAAAS